MSELRKEKRHKDRTYKNDFLDMLEKWGVCENPNNDMRRALDRLIKEMRVKKKIGKVESLEKAFRPVRFP